MQNRKLGKQNRGYTKDTVKTIKQLKEIQKNLLSKKYSKQRKKSNFRNRGRLLLQMWILFSCCRHQGIIHCSHCKKCDTMQHAFQWCLNILLSNVTVVILHSITGNSKNVSKPGNYSLSEVYTNTKVNTTVPMPII